MKNKYVEHAHISERKFRELIRYFALDLNASQIASLTGLSRNTVNRYLTALRSRLVEFCESESPLLRAADGGSDGLDAPWMHDGIGNGKAGKGIVFGIVQQQGNIYTEIVPECIREPLQSLVRGKIDVDSIVNSEGWRGYCALVDVGYGKHLRVVPGRDSDRRGRFQIDGVEGFWGFAKNRLVGYRGRNARIFNLHLKESEFRYNFKGQDLYPMLLRMLRSEPLKLMER